MNFNIGFEIEFCSHRSITRRKIKEDLELLGFSFKGNIKEKFQIVDDLSIEAAYPLVGHEIITPPRPYSESMKILEILFGYLETINASTNESTGFHTNISFKDSQDNRKFNILNFLFSIPEDIGNSFGRMNNKFCKPITNIFRFNNRFYVHKEPSLSTKKKMVLGRMFEIMSKYHYCNIGHWKNKKYLEFRYMGNTDYHLRFLDIQTEIKNLCLLMNNSIENDEHVETIINKFKFECVDK